jgi:hypothetical protein
VDHSGLPQVAKRILHDRLAGDAKLAGDAELKGDAELAIVTRESGGAPTGRR